MTDTLETGIHWVALVCPRCGITEAAAIDLEPILTMTDRGDSTLKIRAKSRPIDHQCGQSAIDLPDRAGSEV